MCIIGEEMTFLTESVHNLLLIDFGEEDHHHHLEPLGFLLFLRWWCIYILQHSMFTASYCFIYFAQARVHVRKNSIVMPSTAGHKPLLKCIFKGFSFRVFWMFVNMFEFKFSMHRCIKTCEFYNLITIVYCKCVALNFVVVAASNDINKKIFYESYTL